MDGTRLTDAPVGAIEPSSEARPRHKAGPLDAHYGRIGIAAVAAALAASRRGDRPRTVEAPPAEGATGKVTRAET